MQEELNRQELDYIRIGNEMGGNQDWLPEWDMNRGGCAAVTACDLCLYLAVWEKFPALYPFGLESLNKEDFIRFTQIMKPYLAPRSHGIDFLETYLSGLADYWRGVGFVGLRAEGLSGMVPYETAEAIILAQLDAGLPIPYLMLRHWDPSLEDLEWHWFNLAGYEKTPEGLLVKAVTYGRGLWLDLRRLWDTRADRRGGLIRLF
ncbi:MAG: hypothetical protein K5841_10660 [Fretibacterium sp.]|nr:hypothetical protein [Fretibacterium sp.]